MSRAADCPGLSCCLLVPLHTVTINPESLTGREEEEMTVRCRAAGGPPAPRISWTFPDSLEQDRLTNITDTTSVLEDDSLETVSEVTFTPTSSEDLEVVQCHAINDVMTEAITTEAVLDIQRKLTMKAIICRLRLMIQTRPE